MGDVGDLEQRIAAALDRIGTGLDVIASGEPAQENDGQIKALTDALDAEKSANAQLEERVVAIKDKQETLVQGLEVEVGKLRQEVTEREADARSMKQRNRQLRDYNRALRDANKQGVGDADLINNSMAAELEALRENQASDRHELDAILVDLMPLVEGRKNA